MNKVGGSKNKHSMLFKFGIVFTARLRNVFLALVIKTSTHPRTYSNNIEVQYTNMTPQWGYPDGMSPEGG